MYEHGSMVRLDPCEPQRDGWMIDLAIVCASDGHPEQTDGVVLS